MLTRKDLLDNAKGKLMDAEILYKAGRYDSSCYLCGYAVELALKARILKHLKWVGIPDKVDRSSPYQIIKTHDPDYLLQFTGIETKLKPALQAEWSVALKWGPELRYQHGVKKEPDARQMLDSAKKLVEVIKR